MQLDTWQTPSFIPSYLQSFFQDSSRVFCIRPVWRMHRRTFRDGLAENVERAIRRCRTVQVYSCLHCISNTFTLVYEILFLSKERELDTQIVDQLDKERSQAELQALTNEMDPHFIFNSLNTLNHLILHQPLEAHSFNNRLAQVYKYFLINKNKELIPLKDELEFIESYFYLLQIRHDDKLQLQTVLNGSSPEVLIPPCSLQILVENAIKHNEFTEENPLQIKVMANDKYLYVSNNIKPKPYAVHSTGIGLKNLSSRYRILLQKDIHIESTRENFTVKLPLIN